MAKLFIAAVLLSGLVGPAMMQQDPLQNLGQSLGQGLSNLPGMDQIGQQMQQGTRQPMQNGGGLLGGLLGGGGGGRQGMNNQASNGGGLSDTLRNLPGMRMLSSMINRITGMLPGMGRNANGMRGQMNQMSNNMPSNPLNQMMNRNGAGLLTDTTRPVNDLLRNLQGGNQNGLNLEAVTRPVDQLLQGVTGGNLGQAGALLGQRGQGGQGGGLVDGLTRTLSNVMPRNIAS